MYPVPRYRTITPPPVDGVEFIIVSSHRTFEPESYRTRASAQARMERIAEMDPVGFAEGAYEIRRYVS